MTLGNDLCSLSSNGVSPFARQVAEMVSHCAMILATGIEVATAEDSRKSVERFNWLMSKVARIIGRGVALDNVRYSVVAIVAKSRTENDSGNEKDTTTVRCGVHTWYKTAWQVV